MEVPGKGGLKDEDDILCQPCEDLNVYTRSGGFCMQCEEHMCKTCFQTHKQFKLNREHTLTDTNESMVTKEQSDDLEKCKQHFNELVKFYCPEHDQVGCGDCMVLEHKTCKVEYIRDIGRTFKDSRKSQDLIKAAEKYHKQAKEIAASIKNNKIQARDINDKFVQDVQMFSDDIISQINKLKESTIAHAETVKSKDIENMQTIEKENEELMKEITRLTELFESQVHKPNRLFISYVLQTSKLKRLQEIQASIEKKNSFQNYKFKRNDKLKRIVEEAKVLGNLQKTNEGEDETDVQEGATSRSTAQNVQFIAPNKVQSLQDKVDARKKADDQTLKLAVPKKMVKPQRLKDTQLVCRNIEIDGEYLSSKLGEYIEIEIISTGQHGTIALGFVPDGYPENHLPGWGTLSVGYHADDGHLYHERGFGTNFGPKCKVGDRMGCYLQARDLLVFAAFTRNGEKVGECQMGHLRAVPGLYPAVGLHSTGEKVKVIFDANVQDGATSRSTAQNVQFMTVPKKMVTPLKPQPLKDKKMVCRNIEMDGAYLSYIDSRSRDVGIYVFKSCKLGEYTEIEIVSTGQHGTIALGFVPDGYPENCQPGWREDSVGYHADDGGLYLEKGYGEKFGPKCNVGDRMGCFLQCRRDGIYVTFTRNGKMIADYYLCFPPMQYPAISLHSTGEKVKVIFDARKP